MIGEDDQIELATATDLKQQNNNVHFDRDIDRWTQNRFRLFCWLLLIIGFGSWCYEDYYNPFNQSTPTPSSTNQNINTDEEAQISSIKLTIAKPTSNIPSTTTKSLFRTDDSQPESRLTFTPLDEANKEIIRLKEELRLTRNELTEAHTTIERLQSSSTNKDTTITEQEASSASPAATASPTFTPTSSTSSSISASNAVCHKQINIEEYCKKHTCGDQLEDLEIETKKTQTKTKQTSILLNLNTFYKLQEKEKVFSWTSTTVGMVNYFNIIQHKATSYLYYRCDCIQYDPNEEGGCVCLRTSQDNGLTFSKETRIPKISNCLAFYVFIDTKPGTKPEEIFKAVYGVNERHGDGQWMAAASSDGLVWKDLGLIWNRAKLTRSSSFIYAFDALNTVYYDNDIGRYVAYARSVKQWSSRGVMHASTSDFMNWPNKNWQEVEFDPPLKSGESLYLMNGLKCPLPNCPYNMGFSSLYNSHENNDCNARRMMPHHADCEEGYQDTFFTIGNGNKFKRPTNFNVFDRKSEQYFPRNTWPAAGSIINEEEETVSYYIAHDVNLPNSYLQRYTMPFYRWASQSCQEEECTISYDLGLASDIEDITLNIKTYSLHSKVTYSLIFGDQQSFSCNHANAAAFMGNEKAYSIRFGYQKWEHVKKKYASTHATGGLPMVYDWYNKNPREKWPLKMPKKGMNYKNCYFNSLQCLSKTDPTFATANTQATTATGAAAVKKSKYTCVVGAGPSYKELNAQSDIIIGDGDIIYTYIRRQYVDGIVDIYYKTHSATQLSCEQFCDEAHTCIAFDLDLSKDSCRLYATIVNARTGSSAPPGRTWCSKTTATTYQSTQTTFGTTISTKKLNIHKVWEFDYKKHSKYPIYFPSNVPKNYQGHTYISIVEVGKTYYMLINLWNQGNS